ncbi:kinase-like domain-containing protein [Gigaspora rosea]|uniref:Kinase-like domain-containing protein n=1 Tax=Gigaspora rosea TaxID=44941 RepID=A0A397VIJ6_9GLOM|nr:kinase-like domain-containing protein [Gigaspora rosea]
MNRYEESLADLNKLLEIEPNNADALRNRGATYYMLTRYEESRKDLVKSLEMLVNRQKIGKGGFGTIYSAIWLDGKPIIRDNLRAREQSCKVALKSLNNLEISLKLNGLGLEIYGITQNIENKTYLMVFQYADNGNKYDFLISNFKRIDWENKLRYLIDVLNDLTRIHESGYVHCDFHSGNILLNQYKIMMKSFVTDLGLSKNLKESASKGEVYGVMPYVAPEILLGGEYTQASDIYGLGIIMTELSTGKRSFMVLSSTLDLH